MSFETKLTILTIIGSVAISALLLWVWDYFYTASTGKRPSERVRERMERRHRPLTPGRYWGTFLFYVSCIFLFAYTAVWSSEYRGWWRLIPMAWLISFGFGVYELQSRWQQMNEANQSSGGAT
ncbi:MAG: hypothetical protein WBH24_14210 [Candidatus Acidiferrum sp.]